MADAADLLDVHAMAMVLAVGATAAHPRLALELAAELAGTRGAETLTRAGAVEHVVDAFEAGLRKTLARMGISAIAIYIGGSLVDTVDLAPDVDRALLPDGRGVARPDDAAATSASAPLRRRAAALALPPTPAGREPRLPDPGFARFRGDGEAHLFAPKHRDRDPGPVGLEARRRDRPRRRPRHGPRALSDGAGRDAGAPSVPRDELRIRRVPAPPAARPRSRTRGRSPAGSWSPR